MPHRKLVDAHRDAAQDEPPHAIGLGHLRPRDHRHGGRRNGVVGESVPHLADEASRSYLAHMKQEPRLSRRATAAMATTDSSLDASPNSAHTVACRASRGAQRTSCPSDPASSRTGLRALSASVHRRTTVPPGIGTDPDWSNTTTRSTPRPPQSGSWPARSALASRQQREPLHRPSGHEPKEVEAATRTSHFNPPDHDILHPVTVGSPRASQVLVHSSPPDSPNNSCPSGKTATPTNPRPKR